MGLVLAAVVALFVWLARDREPVFAGRPLGFWLEELEPSWGESEAEQHVAARRIEAAKRALRLMGPAAVPGLLTRIEKRGSRVRAYIGEWLNEFPGSTFDPRPSQRGRERAAWAFEIIGPAGSNAVPRLMLRLDDRVLGEPAQRALAGIGAPAVPHLRRELSGSDPLRQELAIVLLGRIGPDSREAGSALLAISTDTKASPTLARSAMLALGLIGFERQKVLALASASLLVTNSSDNAAMTLAALDYDGLPFLLMGLTNAAPAIQMASASGLALADNFARHRQAGDVESQRHLRSHLGTMYRLRMAGARMVFQGGNGDRYCAVLLTNLHRTFPVPSRELAARVMGSLSGQAEVVRPSLEALTNDGDPAVRVAAWDALWAMGSAPEHPPATNAAASPPVYRRGRRAIIPP